MWPYLLAAMLLLPAAATTVALKKLSPAAAVSGFVSGMMIFCGLGYTGLLMLAVFFVTGTLSTSWKKAEKMPWKSRNDQSVKRNALQVWANGGTAAVAAMIACSWPEHGSLWRLAAAAALASATADTLSAELGMVYGSRFFNILTFKKDRKGSDGVVSLEGLMIGLAASILIAGLYCGGTGGGFMQGLFIVAGGTVGNLSDSFLGASLERRGRIGNDLVNLLNTVTAAAVACLMAALLR